MGKAKKKRNMVREEIPCIVFLSSNKNKDEELAEKKENRQFKYIYDYAKAHGLVPVRIARRGCMSQNVCNQMFERCLSLMYKGKARAVVVANMASISSSLCDAYKKIGLINENGFKIFSVDEGELKLKLIGFKEEQNIEEKR